VLFIFFYLVFLGLIAGGIPVALYASGNYFSVMQTLIKYFMMMNSVFIYGEY